ncbi:TonB-dependent receptor [Salisaeta longa]|uniref:TonB-dependent receptor n=1 Tax=Salisaeta longa TaxID=503170 RepID=UPI0003B57B2F|nr:TonB-dependent receptor [Salisaeta longa]
MHRLFRSNRSALPLLLAFLMSFGLWAAPAAAQTTGRIAGVVVDASTGDPLRGVNIGLRGTTLGTATNRDGRFVIADVPPETYVLAASFIGYETIERTIVVPSGETTRVRLAFAPTDIELQGVEVIGRRAQSYTTDYSFVATKSATPLPLVPQSVSVVTKEVLEDQQIYRLNDVFKNVAGVTTFSGYNDYTSRGFRNQDARLINGLKAGFSFWTNPILPHIERVEIIKGPASALFANTNPGGTINMVTKKPLAAPRQAIDFTLGSYDTYRATADFTGPLTDDRTVLYRLNVGYENADSFRRLQFNESLLIAPSVSFLPTEDTRVNVDFVYSTVSTRLDRGQPIFNETENLTSTPISFSLSQPGDFMDNTNFHVTASLSHEFTDWLAFNSSYMKFRYDHDLEEHRTSNVFLPNDPTTLQLAFIKRKQTRTVDNVTNYFTIDGETGALAHQGLLGFDFLQQDDNRTQWGARGAEFFILPDGTRTPGGNVGNFSLTNPTYTIEGRNPSTYVANWFSQPWLIDPVRRRTYGLYAQDQIQWNDLRVLLSMRHEWYYDILPQGDGTTRTVEQTSWLPRVGVVYSVLDGLNIYGTYTEGFQPQAASVIINPQVGGPFDPEESLLYEGGAKATLFGGRLSATTAIYQITKQNVLVSANDPGNPERLVQRGEERSRGIEFEVAGSPVEGLQLTANYAYNNAVITEAAQPANEGDVKENAPHHMGGFWATYTLDGGPLEGLGAGAGAHFVTERNTFEESLQLPGYTVANASVFYTVNNFKITATINNVFDKTYWVGGYNFGRLYPGAPRTMLLKVGYTF